jgi:hypothetical protein
MGRRADWAPYRRRRPLPAVIILVLLAAASAMVWTNVLRHKETSTEQSVCPASTHPSAGLPTITPLPYTALDAVEPVPPAEVHVHMLNGTKQVGLATRIGYELQDYGVVPSGLAGNDPRYPTGDMRCFGQIRFGPDGSGQARTLSLLVPCAQLVRDNRQGSTVDLALGSYFTGVAPSSAATEVLAQLGRSAQGGVSSGGGLQSQAARPSLPAGLLAQAHTWRC